MPSHASTRSTPGGPSNSTTRQKRHRDGDTDFVARETRSYEVAHVHGLWHLDFHESSRAILTTAGE
jgi:hypothetical protein